MHDLVLTCQDILVLTCQDILGGLARIHSLQIVHRDVKPENILVANEMDPPFLARLGDFGEAVKCLRGQTLREQAELPRTWRQRCMALALSIRVLGLGSLGLRV